MARPAATDTGLGLEAMFHHLDIAEQVVFVFLGVIAHRVDIVWVRKLDEIQIGVRADGVVNPTGEFPTLARKS